MEGGRPSRAGCVALVGVYHSSRARGENEAAVPNHQMVVPSQFWCSVRMGKGRDTRRNSGGPAEGALPGKQQAGCQRAGRSHPSVAAGRASRESVLPNQTASGALTKGRPMAWRVGREPARGPRPRRGARHRPLGRSSLNQSGRGWGRWTLPRYGAQDAAHVDLKWAATRGETGASSCRAFLTCGSVGSKGGWRHHGGPTLVSIPGC